MRPFDELSDRTHYAACSVVENTTPQGNAAAAYLCIRCTTGPTLLLTESEFALARSRAQVNPEDVPAWRDLVGEPKPSPNEDEPQPGDAEAGPCDDGEDWTVPEPTSGFHGTHPDAEDLP